MQYEARGLWRGTLLGGLLLSGACDLSIDPALTKPDEDAADAGAQEGCRPEEASCQTDAGTLLDASDVDRDADASHIGDEGGEPPGEDAGTACTEDDACGAEAMCSASGRCEPRCDDVRGCAGPRIQNMGYGTMLGAGDTMFWATWGGQDRAGNILPNGAVWSWDREGEPIVVTSGFYSPHLALFADGYLYYREMADGRGWSSVERVRAEAGAEPESWQEQPVDQVWVTQSHLWWTHVNDDVSELWRRARTGSGADEKVKTASLGAWPSRWLIGNEQSTFYETNTVLQIMPLADGPARTVADATWLGEIESIVLNLRYLAYTWQCWVTRIDLSTLMTRSLAALGEWPHQCWGTRAVLRGDWVVWFSNRRVGDEQTELLVGRSHIDRGEASEILATLRVDGWPPRDGTADAGGSMVLGARGDEIVYYHPKEKRLFTLAIAALPCTDSLPCPNGTTCRADQTCR